jgi:hypothetical protein
MGAEGSSQCDVHDAKTNLSRIIERVEHGEEIAIKARPRTFLFSCFPLNPYQVHDLSRLREDSAVAHSDKQPSARWPTAQIGSAQGATAQLGY